MSSVAHQARQYLEGHYFLSARELLTDAISKNSQDADIWCEHLICEAFYGNESFSTENFGKAKGAERETYLETLLSRFYYCKKQIAAKNNIVDAVADAWLEAHPYQRDPHVGVTISACLIVKDEEKVLDACLTSLRGIVDEIVVVDTGSKDKTVEIAKSHGAILGKFKWINDFSAARNHALSLASSHWALWIDADEVLDPCCKEAFEHAVTRSHMGGYSIQIVNYLDEGGTTTEFVHCPTRLFRRLPGIEFSEPIHEQITPSMMRLKMPWTPLDGAKIHHHGYRQEALDAKDKIHRTLSMLELVVAANPNDPFQLFNLANTYFVARRYEEAARAAESSVNLLSPAGAEYGPAVYQVWATSLEQTSRPQEWLAVCRKCQQSSYHTIVNQYLLASCLMTLGEYKEALAAIEICLKMDWPTDLIGDKGIADFRRYGLHAQILGCLDRWEESLQGFEDTLKRQPGFPASNLGRAIALHEVKRFDEALEAYSLVLSEISYRSQAHFRMGQILEDREELRKAQEHYMLAWQSDVDRMDIWAKWVDTLSRLGDHAAVNHAYEALVNVKDVTSDVLVNWAHALLRTGEHAEAIACLHEAHQKNPQDSNVLFTLGDALYVSEKYADAAQVYESAVRMRMDYPEGWFVLGNTLAQMHLDEAASKCYQQTIALDPSHSAAKQNLLALKQAA